MIKVLMNSLPCIDWGQHRVIYSYVIIFLHPSRLRLTNCCRLEEKAWFFSSHATNANVSWRRPACSPWISLPFSVKDTWKRGNSVIYDQGKDNFREAAWPTFLCSSIVLSLTFLWEECLVCNPRSPTPTPRIQISFSSPNFREAREDTYFRNRDDRRFPDLDSLKKI